MNAPNPQFKRFQQLLSQIREGLLELRQRNRTLAEENRRLRDKIEEMEAESGDIFSTLGESDRIALRHQIDGLIAKIDRHLEG